MKIAICLILEPGDLLFSVLTHRIKEGSTSTLLNPETPHVLLNPEILKPFQLIPPLSVSISTFFQRPETASLSENTIGLASTSEIDDSEIVLVPMTNVTQWMVAGDFNCVVNEHRRIGGAVASSQEMHEFQQRIEQCQLQEMRFQGTFYAQSNK
ncbi:hypothetical protein Cgig2_012932 [Carnegiea gigantea]|uniref:Uncharacterized protein n=1 Tax=Carnegiea gigantea TaxID=171969 RepID=A0A9Q1JEX2_9CARY|nr:hypothetical protein Cgig2_012932 [Carnegiea gigantea]